MNKDIPLKEFDGKPFQFRGKYVADVTRMTLGQWLDSLVDDEIYVEDFRFPTDKLCSEYLGGVSDRSDVEVRELLRHLLISRGRFGSDMRGVQYRSTELPDLDLEFDRRFFRQQGEAWEGTTWVLDLLPHWPRSALEALNAYFLAHCQLLPDKRLDGLSDAMAVVRAKYITAARTPMETGGVLLDLTPMEFEALIAYLYSSMGFDVSRTQQSRDGGVDITCSKGRPGEQERILVQCKRHSKNIGVEPVRDLLGVVSSEKCNKGVLVSTAGFTKPARDFSLANPRVELIAVAELGLLLNEHLGPTWPSRIDRLIADAKLLGTDVMQSSKAIDSDDLPLFAQDGQ